MTASSITVEPEVSSIGAPVRIRATNCSGSILAAYTDLPGISQTLEPDREGIVMATFSYSGSLKVSAAKGKGKGRVEADLRIR